MLNAHIVSRENWPLINGNPIPYLYRLRDNTPAPHRNGTIGWPAGKFALGSFVGQNGGRTPENVALIRDGHVVAGAGPDVDSFLKTLPPGEYFCKPDRRKFKAGAFRLDILGSSVLADGEPESLDVIGKRLAQTPYLVQTSLTPLQHPEIARFNANTINTLRLLTYDTQTGPKTISAALRIACSSAAVDSWAAGGVLVPANIDAGELGQHGVVREGLVIVDAHPQTGLRFGGQRLPHYREAVQMAYRLHAKLDLASVAWDIALLRDGPCIIEANPYWDIYFSAQLDPGFLRGFLEFHLAQGTAAIQLEISGSFAPGDELRMWLCEIIGRSRASARVILLSRERLVLMVGGSPKAIETVMGYVMASARTHRLGDIRTMPTAEPVAPGLDIRATFSG